MKKVTPEAIVFQPSIQVHDAGARWAISFDSGSNRDLKRESRTLWVQKDGIKQLDVQVEGFDRLDDDARSFAGRIQLVASYASETTDSRLLAECALSPWAQHRSLKPGDTVQDVSAAVRNGTAAAFTDVLPDLFPPRNMTDLTERVAEHVIKRGGAGNRGERSRSFGHRTQGNRLQRWKPWLVGGGVAAVLWVLLAIAGKPGQPQQSVQAVSATTSPELQTLLQNQGLQPQSGVDAQAQVELVKSTLKSMGLDPGTSGDTGCLVQPH